MDTRRISVRLPEEHVEVIREHLARREDGSLSGYVRAAVQRALANGMDHQEVDAAGDEPPLT